MAVTQTGYLDEDTDNCININLLCKFAVKCRINNAIKSLFLHRISNICYYFRMQHGKGPFCGNVCNWNKVSCRRCFRSGKPVGCFSSETTSRIYVGLTAAYAISSMYTSNNIMIGILYRSQQNTAAWYPSLDDI